MANKHLYFGIENLNLNSTQRGQLITALQGLGASNGSFQPAERIHWRIRNDNQAAIFEALFDEDTLSVASMKARLATIFGVAVGTISHAVATASFGAGTTQVVTFTRSGTDYIRAAVFGGLSATHEESRVEALAFIVANAAEWAA